MVKSMKSKLFLFSSFLLLICSIIVIGFLCSPGICLNNKCATYVEKYLYQLPKDQSLLEEIDKTTEQFLLEDTFNKNYFFSRFQINFVRETFSFEETEGFEKTDLKQKFFLEVVILRLRVLAINGENQEYLHLFKQYCDDISACAYTRSQYIDYWKNDENYPLKPDSELYTLIFSAYADVVELCSNDMDRYHMLLALSNVYMLYGEHYKQQIEWCQNEIQEIIKKNERDIFLDKLLTWNGFENQLE